MGGLGFEIIYLNIFNFPTLGQFVVSISCPIKILL
jgi:hypothetical protein